MKFYLNLKKRFIRLTVMPKYNIYSDLVSFLDADCQVATVVMETAQLVLSQF